MPASDWKGKQLIFGLNRPPSRGLSPYPTGGSFETTINATKAPFLYVSSDCTISRDALRNSGYKIVRSKEKASAIILPKLREFATYTFNICILKASGAVTFVQLTDLISGNIKKEEVETFIHFLKTKTSLAGDDENSYTLIYDEDSLKKMTTYVIPKCADYADLWGRDEGDWTFGFENNILLTPTVEVTPELFTIWDKCKDMWVLACALTQVDWQKYPVTLATYLYDNKTQIRQYVNTYQKHILEQIGFYQLWNNGTINRAVEPEDWNMLQKCRLALLGLPETGGLVKPEKVGLKVGNLPCRIQVKPLYITEPAMYEDLLTAVKNM